MVDPPRIGRGRDFSARLERRDEHVDRRRQEEDRKQHEEEVRPAQRPAPVAAHAAVARARRRATVDGDGCGAHYASFPRRWMSRRMKIAQTARMGNMNSDTLAPSGMSPPWMPSRNAQVANTWVLSIGPPAVSTCTMSKFANVTIVENSTVMAMMFRIIGKVTNQMRCH